jgi:uracil-DNA glycosylase family 4
MSDAQACRKCSRMAHSRRVLTNLNGPWTAKIVVVGEAPGRLGAEVTGVPFFGDRTGDRFNELLLNMGWAREQIFITNAILCNPRDECGNNDSPSRVEQLNCSGFLRRTIDTIDPLIVLSLGRVALDSLRSIEDHDFELKRCTGKVLPWNGRLLGILYHPGPRTSVHREWRLQLHDAMEIADLAEKMAGITRRRVIGPVRSWSVPAVRVQPSLL